MDETEKLRIEYAIKKRTLEELLRTSLRRACLDEITTFRGVLGWDEYHFMLAADHNPLVIDTILEVPYERGMRSVTIRDLSPIKRLMESHNVVADAHTHPTPPWAEMYSCARPSPQDLRFYRWSRTQLGRDYKMVIISGASTFVYALTVVEDLHDKSHRGKLMREIRAEYPDHPIVYALLEQCGIELQRISPRNRAPPREVLLEHATQLYMKCAPRLVKMYGSDGKRVPLHVVETRP